MTEIVYGFGPHTLSLKAMQLRADTNIQSIKEESNLSYVNQADDKYVAVQDKVSKKERLTMLRNNTLYNMGLVDPWGVIPVGLFVNHSTDP